MGTQRKVRALLVDDDPVFVDALEAVLELDPRVEVVGRAFDGEEAVLLAEELFPDVVVMDVVMPGLDGIEATREIRASRPDCRVILVSGSIFQERTGKGIEVAHEVGASGFLLKSRAAVDLADCVVSVARSPMTAYSR